MVRNVDSSAASTAGASVKRQIWTSRGRQGEDDQQLGLRLNGRCGPVSAGETGALDGGCFFSKPWQRTGLFHVTAENKDNDDSLNQDMLIVFVVLAVIIVVFCVYERTDRTDEREKPERDVRWQHQRFALFERGDDVGSRAGQWVLRLDEEASLDSRSRRRTLGFSSDTMLIIVKRFTRETFFTRCCPFFALKYDGKVGFDGNDILYEIFISVGSRSKKPDIMVGMDLQDSYVGNEVSWYQSTTLTPTSSRIGWSRRRRLRPNESAWRRSCSRLNASDMYMVIEEYQIWRPLWCGVLV